MEKRQNQPALRVVDGGEFRWPRASLKAIDRELRHLIGEQFLGRHLLPGSLMNPSKVTHVDGGSLEPLTDQGLRNAERLCQPVLGTDNGNRALDSFHCQKISAANVGTQQRRWWSAAKPSISVTYVQNVDRKKAKPTQADLAAAKRLKKAWLDLPRDSRPTQEQLAERWGEGGSQSLISQYLNGVIPLNIRATLFFAREFGADPHDIYPDLPGLDVATAASHQAAEDELDREWRNFPRELKAQIIETVRRAQGARAPEQANRATPPPPRRRASR